MLAIFKRHRIDDVDIESPLATERLKNGDVPLPPVPESVIVPTIVAVVTCPLTTRGIASSPTRTANWIIREPKFLTLNISVTSKQKFAS